MCNKVLFIFLLAFAVVGHSVSLQKKAVVGHVGSVSTVPVFRGVQTMLEAKNLSLQAKNLSLHSNDALNLKLRNLSETLLDHSASHQLNQVPASIGQMLLKSNLLERPFILENLGKTARVMSIGLFILLVAGLLMLCFYEEDEIDNTQTPKISKKLSEEEVFALSEAAWPRAYLMSNWDERKALELLLLCGIIHPDEFQRGDVSDEHVDECTWIAMQMLRQKPLEAWICDPESAQGAFYTSVTSRFPERQHVRSGQITPDFVPAMPSYEPSERGVMDCQSDQKRPSEPVSPAVQPLQHYRRDSSAHIKKVQVRCQELATGNAIDLTPRCMLTALQGMPPLKARDRDDGPMV